jgi:uncharacterized protein (UPF0332 family)
VTRLHDQLLKHAKHLVAQRPTEASLGRAVSTAYYALFHLLLDAAAQMMLPGQQSAQFACFRASVKSSRSRCTLRNDRFGTVPTDCSACGGARSA